MRVGARVRSRGASRLEWPASPNGAQLLRHGELAEGDENADHIVSSAAICAHVRHVRQSLVPDAFTIGTPLRAPCAHVAGALPQPDGV